MSAYHLKFRFVPRYETCSRNWTKSCFVTLGLDPQHNLWTFHNSLNENGIFANWRSIPKYLNFAIQLNYHKVGSSASHAKTIWGAKNERADEINIEEQVEMIPEKSPVAESKANGEVQRYIHTEQGQVRPSKAALETMYQRKIGEKYNILP